ncbi:MAG: hypothetical protein IV298_16060 [Cylindrospermopsis raciborskii KL1]|uniref:hypothetical protein n=1 Tax=Cylindrospermopsis raciborskii TaxID=77022 RepID=UPI001A328B2F|nr:hypothetical protein [Cylindrospermopsis raciborskii]MBG0744944.1 hypothetical protein [Cylindrospermopsis raciborskii KL1]
MKGVKSAIARSEYFRGAFTYLPTVRYQGKIVKGVKGDLAWRVLRKRTGITPMRSQSNPNLGVAPARA